MLLITNDDGIHAEGLKALYREISREAECLIVAPEREQSAVGHAITLSRPLMVRSIWKGNLFFGHAVSGTPADCVKIGVKELAQEPVECIVSGINLGANVGVNVIYSGTVSAATEGTILGIPSIAFSLDTRDRNADFSFAAGFARNLVAFLRKRNFPFRGVTLNVNIPAIPADRIQGVAITTQGSARFIESFEKRMDPRENTYYWLAGETFLPETESGRYDAYMVSKGIISITPIHYDLTKHEAVDALNDMFQDFPLNEQGGQE